MTLQGKIKQKCGREENFKMVDTREKMKTVCTVLDQTYLKWTRYILIVQVREISRQKRTFEKTQLGLSKPVLRC